MKFRLTILLAVFLSFQCLAQEGSWASYLKASRAGRPMQEGQTLWVPTDAGLLEVNLESNSVSVLNKATAGLSSNSIESVARDPINGDFFIGTYDVALLSRPEQEEAWTVLPYPEAWAENSFNPMQSYCLQFDENGNLFVGTNQGLLRYDGQEWERFDQSNGHPFLGSVWDIQPAPDGGLYLASHLLLHYKDGEVTEVSPEQVGNQFLFAYSGGKMYQQEDGNLWFFTDIGTAGHYDGQEWEVVSQIGGQPFFQGPSFIGETPEGNLLVFLDNIGLYQYKDGDWEPYDIDIDEGILQLHFPEGGWVAVYADKVAIHRNGQTEDVYFNTWPFENSPYYFRNDANGQLWAKDGYNSILNLDTWERLTPEGEESPEFITDYSFGPDGTLWSVSSNAVYTYAQGSWNMYGPDNSALPATTGYRNIVSDGDGGAWLYVYNNGLYHFSNGAWKKQQHPIFGINYLLDMVPSDDGILWVHLYDNNVGARFASWDGSQLNIFTEGEEGFRYSMTDAFCFDRETGLFWAIGPDGIQYYDGQSWQQQAFAPGLPSAEYYTTLIVRSGQMVACSWDNVYIRDNGQWSAYSKDNTPLANERLAEVGLGAEGAVWAFHQGSRVVDRFESGIVSQDRQLPQSAVFSTLHLFPNPAREVLMVELAGSPEPGYTEILLFNALGQLQALDEQNMQLSGQSFAVPVSALKNGWYLLVVKNGNKAYAASFLKQ
ncbi:MAG: T9SS type A sorting domain-containing protein [Lewinellaceae bacterium]|nr:T9SS type A sorting domain-containing protein [Lewinellaceae bacterium]